MSEPISDADKIRAKRLAKLGAPAAQASSSGEAENDKVQDSAIEAQEKPTVDTSSENLDGAASASSQAESKAAINITSQGANHTQTADNPFAQLGLEPKGNDGTVAKEIHSQSPMSSKRDSRGAARPKSQQRAAESLEVWEDRQLSTLFKMTLNPQVTKDLHGNPMYFLSGTRSEMDQEGVSSFLSTSQLDQAILEVASNQSGVAPLDYLLACWKRVSRQFRSMKAAGAEESRFNVIKEARRLCMSYCIFAVTIPEMFNVDETEVNPLAKYLLVDPDNDHGICQDFLTEAVARFPDDESIRDALVAAAEQLSAQLSSMTMNDDYKPYVLALRNLARYPPLVEALSQSSRFLIPNEDQLSSRPDVAPAHLIEKETLLGPFFALSPMQPAVAKNYFSSPKTRDQNYIANSQHALRLTLQTHQVDLLDIVNLFIKSSKISRERTLEWFAIAMNTNHKRRAIQVDERYVSSDSFMVNVTVSLDQLSEPFMDATFSKIHRIEVDYLRRSSRVNIKDETKLNADQASSDKFYEKRLEGVNNFISEIFFLTVAAHHYGTEAANNKLSTLRRYVQNMERQIEKLEEERKKHINNPVLLARFDDALKKYKDGAETRQCTYLATEGVLLDETTQGRAMLFMRYVIVWLMRLASGSIDFPKHSLQLPLPEEQTEVFKCLPEYFVEDIVDSFKFITAHMPQVVSSTQCDELVMICITFLSSSEYIKNPYLKSGLVTILFHGVMPVRYRTKGILGDVLNALPFATQHLLHALMKFYIECEATGLHTQFYDKFRIRYEIFQVIRCIWSNPVYRENLEKESKQNLEFFVRFTNLLLNDVTYLLDEAFTAFNKIHDLQKDLREGSSSVEEAVRAEREEALDEAKNKAKNYMSLTVETLAMLKLFTDSLADAFTTPEVVQRLADMLDYNLDALVGPKQSNLKVENPAEYNFNPKALLSDILDVYLNLGAKPAFQLAVARDGRSYKPSNFTQAAAIMSRWALKSAAELARWKRLSDVIQQTKAADDAATEDLGEVPDEFLDPLMATLMDDPVILPVSKAVMDRSTIRSHLLSDPTDPYNRSPLKIEDVIPDVQLKARILAFKEEHKGKRMVGAPGGVDAMDTGL